MGRVPPHNRWYQYPLGFYTGIHVGKKMHMHVGENPSTGQIWKRNEIIDQG